MQVIGSSPQINQGYNLAPLFSYLMKTQGADLTPFEKSPEQVQYEQASQQWKETVIEAMKQGADSTKLPPQPNPTDYNYAPTKQGGAAASPPAPKSQQTQQQAPVAQQQGGK